MAKSLHSLLVVRQSHFDANDELIWTGFHLLNYGTELAKDCTLAPTVLGLLNHHRVVLERKLGGRLLHSLVVPA
jgi:hypothetical protein